MSQLTRWLLVSAATVTLAGCGTGAKVPDTSGFTDVPTTASVPPSAPSSAPPSVQWESSSSAPPSPPPTTSKAAKPSQDQSAGTAGMLKCGTVQAGSGKSFAVTATEDVGCAKAKQTITAFADKVASKQADQPSKPVKEQIDGFSCTAGPAAGQGGTICAKGSSTVFGAVQESE